MLGALAATAFTPSQVIAGALPRDRSAAAQPAGALAFQIPSLPLYEALQRYSGMTRLSVFYETSLIAQKQSAAVEGQYTPRAALDRMLEGTGLAARFTEHRSFVLLAQPTPTQPEAAADPLAQQHYNEDLQTRIVQALCAHPDIEAGHYRLALRFWVNQGQRIDHLYVRAADRPDLEPAIRSALAGLSVDAPPPGTEQPAVMLLTPEAAQRHGSCGP